MFEICILFSEQLYYSKREGFRIGILVLGSKATFKTLYKHKCGASIFSTSCCILSTSTDGEFNYGRVPVEQNCDGSRLGEMKVLSASILEGRPRYL
jgi:hypothetical protein